MSRSNTDVAYGIVKEYNGGVSFSVLWDKVTVINELTPEQKIENISSFYTDLMLDGRFITLGENVWDLRETNAFEKVHIDMNDIYSSEDDDIIEVEEGIIVKEDTDESLFEEEEVTAKKVQEEE
ncbi:DNA-directed RNA polymerase subunit delta [Mycoplasma sp. P36-A1]|uniref:DNA-directed RNA polymerase subunit delta n=1 Tax=Mycoplasma sp. P36-A1 TaxID=3252900 RepID=UPI003C2B48B7